jgi:hypothetical protein
MAHRCGGRSSINHDEEWLTRAGLRTAHQRTSRCGLCSARGWCARVIFTFRFRAKVKVTTREASKVQQHKHRRRAVSWEH